MHQRRRLFNPEDRRGLTSISSAVSYAVEGLHYVYRRDYARSVMERMKCAFRAYRCFSIASDGMQQTTRDPFLRLNANRDGKRGYVNAPGPLAGERFDGYRMPKIIWRTSSWRKTAMMAKICTSLYYQDVPIVPTARISPRMMISLYTGENVMMTLASYRGDRERVERRLWDDMQETARELVEHIQGRLRLREPEVDQPGEIYEALKSMSPEHAGHRDEVDKNVARLRKEPVWPFIDMSWRNTGLEDIHGYAHGKGRIVLYDPDRFDRVSSKGFNLAHIAFMDWHHIPLQERLGILPSPEGAFHYLLKRVARAEQFGIPRTDAVLTDVERSALQRERRDLLDVIEECNLWKQYPEICNVITDAASAWDL